MSWMLSDGGAAFIMGKEGTRLVAYQDTAGVWTIGCGHTADVQPGDRLTMLQALLLFKADCASRARFVSGCVSTQMETNQDGFDAMVSLTYNIGEEAFRTSSVLRKHLAGDWYGAQAAFLLWDKAHVDGVLVEVPGLRTRREAEAALYLKPVATKST